MSGQKDAFVVPAGLVFRQEEGGLAIEHDGDIVLHGSLGHALQSVRSNQGNIELFLDAELKEVAAHRGTVKIHGSLKAESVHGKTIDVDGSVQAEGLYGGQIRVGGTLEAGNVNAMEAGVHIGGDATTTPKTQNTQTQGENPRGNWAACRVQFTCFFQSFTRLL